MLHAGLDLGRTRLDYCLLDEEGGRVEVGAAAPDGDGLRGFARRVALRHGPVAVRAAIESMNGARFVHDTLERCGWVALDRMLVGHRLNLPALRKAQPGAALAGATARAGPRRSRRR
jgi:hypothetical protein